MRFFFVIAIFILFLHGCRLYEYPDIPDTLIFVEGKELSAGRFGDIVILDSKSDGKIWVTQDRHYDGMPFFADSGNAVFFLSKRRPGDKGLGLQKKNDIYTYNIGTKDIEPIVVKDESFIHNFYGFVKNNSTLLYSQQTVGISNEYEVIKHDYISDNFDALNLLESNTHISSLYTSSDTRFFVFDVMYMGINGIRNIVFYHDSEEHTSVNFLEDIDNYGSLSFSESSCKSGSFITDSTFLFSCQIYSNKEAKIFQYNIETKTITEIFSSNELSMDNPISNYETSKIYFIAGSFEDDEDENIWMIDKNALQNPTAIRVTDSRTNKDWSQIEN